MISGPDPDALRIALEVRRSPLNKEDKQQKRLQSQYNALRICWRRNCILAKQTLDMRRRKQDEIQKSI